MYYRQFCQYVVWCQSVATNGLQLGEPWMCAYFAKLLLPDGAVYLAGF